MTPFEGYPPLAQVGITEITGQCPECEAVMVFGYDEIEHADGALRTAQLIDAFRACDNCGAFVDCSAVVVTIDEAGE